MCWPCNAGKPWLIFLPISESFLILGIILFYFISVLTNDYPGCLGILMRYPPVGDVHYLIDKAMYLRDPNIHPRPPNYTCQRFTPRSSVATPVISTSSYGSASKTSAKHNKGRYRKIHSQISMEYKSELCEHEQKPRYLIGKTTIICTLHAVSENRGKYLFKWYSQN
jgi:hypothetical protein